MNVKIRALTVVVSIFFLQNVAFGQTFEWAKKMGGSNEEEGVSIALDDVGNVHTVGTFRATVDFDPGSGVLNLTSNGQRDAFVQKLDNSGNLVWARSFGGSAEDLIRSVCVDNNGNVYSTGQFFGTVDFDPGIDTNELTSSGYDVFIQKLDASGNYVWAKKIGGLSHDIGYAITADNNGNIYVSGSFAITVDFDPGPGVSNLTSNGSEDIFVLKLDSTGAFLWARKMGGSNQDVGLSIAIDQFGNVISTGRFQGTGDFDPGIGVIQLSSVSANDVFIQKMDSTGNFLWAKSMGGSGSDYGQSIATDIFGNVYTTGFFAGTADFDPGLDTSLFTATGLTDIFIQKLDAFGNYIWAKTIGGSSSDQGFGITVDDSGKVYSTGWFSGAVDFDPDSGVSNLTAVQSDIYVLILSTNGEYIWATDLGGSSSDEGLAIAVSSSYEIFTTGNFGGTVDFDPSPLGSNILVSSGFIDVFVHKMSLCPVVQTTDVVTACNSFTWIDNVTYTSSNSSATLNFINASGCDSIVNLDLTINYSSAATDIITACDSLLWIDGITYTSSNNTATHTLVNSQGCDSLVTLDLTINYSNVETQTITACDSFVWIDGITYTTSNNTATFLLSNSKGCDSLIHLDLTINSSDSSTDVLTACNFYIWIDGITYTSSNNTSVHVMTNSKGCDSVVSLDLTINKVSDLTISVNGYTISSNNLSATYQWLDCDDDFAIIPGETNQSFTALKNGSYACELTENNCVDTTTCAAFNTIGISENTFQENILIYPNPSNGFLSIELGDLYPKVKLSVFDNNGRLILKEQYEKAQSINLNLNTSPGIYELVIDTKENKAEFKIVIE